MSQDLRFAVRMLLKRPGFSAFAILTLALGIGATAAVFSLIQGVLLTPPPYREPERLLLIEAVGHDSWAPAQWLDWQRRARSFEAVAAYTWSFNFLVLAEGSESMEGMRVTQEYFRVAGVQPILGRTFAGAEGLSGSAPVIILGYELWKRRFNGDPHILGKPVFLSRRDAPPRVIGVMPPGVRFLPSPGTAQEPNYNVNALVDYWLPAAPAPDQMKDGGWDVIARLKPGVTPAKAQAEISLMTAREAREEREFEGTAARLRPLTEEMNREGRGILLPLLGAAGLVLLIACGNTAALLLLRGLQRQQEYAVRTALGVARRDLFRQASAESLLLGLLGGSFGVALAFALVRVLKAIGGHAIPRLDAVQAGWPVLTFGMGLALISALLAGLLPALRASRVDAVHVLKSAGPKSSAGRGERRVLRAVTMLQTALTLALLVGAGLLIRTMANISKVKSGYDTAHILTMSVTPVRGNWSDFHHRALEKVSAIPDVQDAAFAWGVPLTGNNWPERFEIEGWAAPAKASKQIVLPVRAVTPGYFQMLGFVISGGRDFRATDEGKAPAVAIVNQAFAERYFSNSSALGKKLWVGSRERPPREIIGVVANARTADLTQAAEPEVYFSLWQATAFSKHLLVRTVGDSRRLITRVERELHMVDPTAAVENVKTLEQVRGDSLASRAFAMQLLVGFSALASALTLMGIYGVLSLSVTTRRRELAIRSAVGASQWHIRGLVLAEGFRLTAGGVAAGVIAALALSRVLRVFLFEVGPADPVTLAGAGLLFAIVALAACWAPGSRAAQTDPLEALRCD